MKNLILFLVGFLPFLTFSQPKNGMRAMNFTLLDQDGKMVALSDYKGQVVLLDFWASWCGPCRQENPNIVEAYNKYKNSKFSNGKGFVVLSVSLDRSEDAWKKAIVKDNLKWDGHVWDKKGEVTRKYGVRSIPHSFLIDGDGKIITQGDALRGIGLHIQIEKLIKK
ncbi:MAG TPA: TlpA disulfide reductase family protein [Brumimicrobium sp.]|nr:TlpA disulfide reductase family protein [Brumimicrobium sp.]